METNNGKDVELKTNFVTREGVYRLLNLSEYSRPNRVGYQSNQNSPQVRVSLVSLPSVSSAATQNYNSSSSTTTQQQQQQQQAPLEKGESYVVYTKKQHPAVLKKIQNDFFLMIAIIFLFFRSYFY